MAVAGSAERLTNHADVADLAARVEQLAGGVRALPLSELCRRADTIRAIAAAGRLLPLARLAAGLRDGLAAEGRGAFATPWLDAMRDSLAGEAQDEATARLFVASVSVRLAG